MKNKNDKRQTIELRSIEGYHPYEGAVLIKPISKEGATTPSGVLIGFNSSTQYGEGIGSHVADLTATEGIVVALPLHHHTEGYEIPNELKVGDRVWFSYFGSLHGVDIFVGDELYRLIDYTYMIAARRGDDIIILNGFVLVEEVNEEVSTELVSVTPKTDKSRGIVRYIGSKCEYPQGHKYTDDIDLNIGDMVLIRKGCSDIKVERQPYLATFSDTPYRRIRRRDIVAVLNTMEWQR